MTHDDGLAGFENRLLGELLDYQRRLSEQRSGSQEAARPPRRALGVPALAGAGGGGFTLPRLPRPRLPRRLAHGEEASLVEHLDELRQRLFVCLGAVALGCVVGYVLHGHIVHWFVLQAPAETLRNQDGTLLTFTPAESFLTSIWISIYFGIVLALPVIFWQVWQFFVPAVDVGNARLIKWFVLLAWALASVGLLFGYFVVLPAALGFLLNYNSDTFSNSLQAKPFLTFCTHVELAMALVWELPLFIVALTQLGIVKTDALRRNRRLGYFLVACLAVALPGVDPVTVFFEALPLLALFEASIWLSVALDRRRARHAATATA